MEQPSIEDEGEFLGRGNQGEVHSAVILVDAARKTTAIALEQDPSLEDLVRETILLTRTYNEEWMQSKACISMQLLRFLQTTLTKEVALRVRDGSLPVPNVVPARQNLASDVGNALMRMRTDRTIPVKVPSTLSHNVTMTATRGRSILVSKRVFPLWLAHDAEHGYAFEGMVYREPGGPVYNEPPSEFELPGFFRVVLDISAENQWTGGQDYYIKDTYATRQKNACGQSMSTLARPFELCLTRRGWHTFLMNLYKLLGNCSNTTVDSASKKQAALVSKRVMQRKKNKTSPDPNPARPFTDAMLRSLGAAYFAMHIGDVDGWDCEVQLANTQATWYRTSTKQRVPQVAPNIIPGLRLIFLDFGMCAPMSQQPSLRDAIRRMRTGMWDRFADSEHSFRLGYRDAMILFWFWTETAKTGPRTLGMTMPLVKSLLPTNPFSGVTPDPAQNALTPMY